MGSKWDQKNPDMIPKWFKKARDGPKKIRFFWFFGPRVTPTHSPPPPPQAPTVSASRQPHTTKEPQKTLKTPKNGRKGQKKPNVVKTTPKRSRNSPNMVYVYPKMTTFWLQNGHQAPGSGWALQFLQPATEEPFSTDFSTHQSLPKAAAKEKLESVNSLRYFLPPGCPRFICQRLPRLTHLGWFWNARKKMSQHRKKRQIQFLVTSMRQKIIKGRK